MGIPYEKNVEKDRKIDRGVYGKMVLVARQMTRMQAQSRFISLGEVQGFIAKKSFLPGKQVQKVQKS